VERNSGYLADLEDFILDHRPHGTLIADATEPVWNGYLPPYMSMWAGVPEVGDIRGC
jgi:hypothetical protein